jgi:hypothetical protein
MRLIFVAPSTRHPNGWVAVSYEFATAMAQRGHEVDLYHVNFFDGTVPDIGSSPGSAFAAMGGAVAYGHAGRTVGGQAP